MNEDLRFRRNMDSKLERPESLRIRWPKSSECAHSSGDIGSRRKTNNGLELVAG
jgi:hypothetical protein